MAFRCCMGPVVSVDYVLIPPVVVVGTVHSGLEVLQSCVCTRYQSIGAVFSCEAKITERGLMVYQRYSLHLAMLVSWSGSGLFSIQLARVNCLWSFGSLSCLLLSLLLCLLVFNQSATSLSL
ncbi:hypothetical protein F2Q68_00035690 [Brassica cretica]|uniref:Uncharacterized protein n=1 Tax=Brassica cretica TaxID=69181 RepID=A0A8S9H2Q8_BRACR|nr:hypothetical protein F2Q68_00035690 [Brassica cretica]